MNYQVCDCDPLEFCEHKKMRFDFINAQEKAYQEWIKGTAKAIEEQRMTWCNCDASCGENRSHRIGSVGCRFATEEEHDMYWRNRRSPELEQRYDAPKPIEDIDYMERPWGRWYVLDVDQGFKVKRLEILPDQAISLQYHNHRSEHWTIVQGKGKVIVDGNIFTIEKGESFHVPRLAMHKITNTHLTETLIAIEVQMGEICSEDDIVRC